MKKAILTAMALLAAMTATTAHASEPVNMLLAGGSEANRIAITVSADGRTYLIDSIAQLEVGGEVCWHPEGRETELECEAAAIGSFEVNSGGGDDRVVVDPKVPIPTTLRGGPGNDRLDGGGDDDKLIGGSGDDVLNGHGGNDSIFGGSGNDILLGGSGDDLLSGGSGEDRLYGQGGVNQLIP